METPPNPNFTTAFQASGELRQNLDAVTEWLAVHGQEASVRFHSKSVEREIVYLRDDFRQVEVTVRRSAAGDSLSIIEDTLHGQPLSEVNAFRSADSGYWQVENDMTISGVATGEYVVGHSQEVMGHHATLMVNQFMADVDIIKA